MKLYTVQITDKALEDMEEIYHYIAEQLQSPYNAMNQYNRIAGAIEKLNIFPERIKVMESVEERKHGLRRLIVDNYSVFYIVDNSCVTVVRVLYSASDIEQRLIAGN